MNSPVGGMVNGTSSRHDPLPAREFLRGYAFSELGDRTPPRRLDADTLRRAPQDTVAELAIPAGVRLEITGDAPSVTVLYRTYSDTGAPWDDSVGRCFEVWAGDSSLERIRARPGEHYIELPLGRGGGRTVIYLPERMRPAILSLFPNGGRIRAAPSQPKWLAYGDSITQGWVATRPSLAWPALIGRRLELDVCNLGFAGSARGEIVIAEQIGLAPDVELLTIAFGTNSWSGLPCTMAMMRAQLDGFLMAIRMRKPELPILVVSPIVRPVAEQAPNGLGATQAQLRATIENTVMMAISAGDRYLHLLSGLDLLDSARLPDGVHPDDAGHEKLACAIGGALSRISQHTSKFEPK